MLLPNSAMPGVPWDNIFLLRQKLSYAKAGHPLPTAPKPELKLKAPSAIWVGQNSLKQLPNLTVE